MNTTVQTTGRFNKSNVENTTSMTIELPTAKQGAKDILGVGLGLAIGSALGPIAGAVAGYKYAQKEWSMPSMKF